MGVGQYRVIGPIKELTQSEQICSFLLPVLNSEKRFLPSVPELVRAKPTVLFLQNSFTDFHLEHLEEYAELLPDIFRVFGQDDIVFSAVSYTHLDVYKRQGSRPAGVGTASGWSIRPSNSSTAWRCARWTVSGLIRPTPTASTITCCLLYTSRCV